MFVDRATLRAIVKLQSIHHPKLILYLVNYQIKAEVEILAELKKFIHLTRSHFQGYDLDFNLAKQTQQFRVSLRGRVRVGGLSPSAEQRRSDWERYISVRLAKYFTSRSISMGRSNYRKQISVGSWNYRRMMQVSSGMVEKWDFEAHFDVST
jgi:hypothetical protein